ncbi:MAG: universal stress protein [Polyangiaceae bacterium]|nr:universal stress protein [Polyangiaceae bacterium]
MSPKSKTFLVPTDFSEPAAEALDHAIGLARESGGHAVVLHVSEIPVIGFPEGALIPTAELVGRITNEAQQALDQLVEQRKGCGVPVEALLKSGDPRDVIHAVADDVDASMIVMGTHGRRGIARTLLGSVTESVIRSATRPVLTVREHRTAEQTSQTG